MPPPLYPNDKDLAIKCDEYFEHCDKGVEVELVRRGEPVKVNKARPYTVPGLACFLGYASRFSIQDLKEDPRHSHTIMAALARIETQRIEKALLGEQEPRFAQFDLINNFKGYSSSKQQVDVQHQITYSDEELDARLAALEHKIGEIGGNAVLIEAPQKKLKSA